MEVQRRRRRGKPKRRWLDSGGMILSKGEVSSSHMMAYIILHRIYIKGFAKKKKFSKNPSLLWKWVVGSRSHSELFFIFLEHHPKIAPNQY